MGIERVVGGMSTSLERHIEGILRNPGLAKHDITWVYQNHHRLLALEAELVTLRAETEKHRSTATRCEKKLKALQLSYEQECLRARKASSALENAEDMNARVRRLADLESKKAREAEDERDREKVRADHIQRQLSKLRAETKHRGAHTAFRKLTLHPTIAKRLAAACHPDKLPSELSEAGSEFFRFVQSIREGHGE